MARAIVRTLKLSKPINEADREIVELEFREPTSELFAEIDRVEAINAHAKRAKDVISLNFAVLAHLTGLGVETLVTMSFRDGKAALRIAGEIAGEGLDEGER